MTLRFGLVGTGYWAEETHAAGLAGHPDAEFVGVWGRDPAKARALAERYQIRPYDDPDQLFADVDAVAFAVPPDIQATLATRAAEAGKHLLLDKPIALTAEAANLLVGAVEKSGVASVVFFTNRFRPAVEEFLRGLVETGPWDGARITMFGSIFQPGNPYGASAWRKEKGGLWDVGPHALALAMPVLGPIEQVAAVAGPHQAAHLLLRHTGGAVSALALTLDAPPAAVAFEYVFHGPSGITELPEADGSAVDALRVAVTQLAAAAREDRPEHPCDVRFGRDVVNVLAAAESALWHRRVIEL
jgi:predicted dehydrogenase